MYQIFRYEWLRVALTQELNCTQLKGCVHAGHPIQQWPSCIFLFRVVSDVSVLSIHPRIPDSCQVVQYCNHDHHPTRLWPPWVVEMVLFGSLSNHDDHGNKNIFDNDLALPVCLSVLHISQWFSSYLRREMTCSAVLQFCSDMDDERAWQ